MKRFFFVILCAVFLVSPLTIFAQEETVVPPSPEIISICCHDSGNEKCLDVFTFVLDDSLIIFASSSDIFQKDGAGVEHATMVARYYDGKIGRLNSIDTVYNAMGNEALIRSKTDLTIQKLLENPQALNSYSYALNNPLVVYDPSGEWIEYFIGNQNAVSLGNWANNLYNNSTVARYAMDHPLQTGAAAGVLGGAAAAGGVVAAGGTITCGAICGPAASTIIAGSGTLGSQADKAQRSFQEIGKAGEMISDLTKNTEHIPSITGAAYRIPDGLNHTTKIISEVKNVAYQSYTKQLVDFVSYAQQKGYKFELYVRPTTQLSSNLQKAVDSGKIILKTLNIK